MKQVFAIWILLAANLVFEQDTDLSIELEVRPSLILATDQDGLLDVIITNHGPTERVGTFSTSGDFSAVGFSKVISGQCSLDIIDPPPPGRPFFGVYSTPVLPIGDSETCTFPFQLNGSVPQSTVVNMKVRSEPSQPEDPNQSNNVASITLTFWDARPVPSIGPIALLMLCALILLKGAIKGRKFLRSGE